MKRIFFLITAILCSVVVLAQTGYRISATLKPYKNQYVYLGYYYGKLKAIADSAMLDNNSLAIFTGKEKLPGGIYFLVSPRKEILFEVLIDRQQQFSISADTTNLAGTVTFTGSADNTMFQAYSSFVSGHGREITSLMAQLKSGPVADSARLTARVQQLNKEIQAYRNDIETKHPSSLLTALFRAMKEPTVPPATTHPGKEYDSAYAFNYFKSHYWDGVPFSDDRLLRTPIFEPKLDKYYKDLVLPMPDSIKKEIDAMLLKTAGNKEMYKFLLTHFVQKYINPEYMGQDAVFVHLFEKYINHNPQVDWFPENYKKHMSDRAYSLMANLIGQPAANLEMVDTSGKRTALYDVKAPFTIVCFWDPTCGHCKEVVPKLDSMYQARWKAMGVKLYGVMVDGGKDAWVSYIREKNLKGWLHVYETVDQKDAVNAAGKPGYRQLYDVYQTPVLYLLDADKRIVAKRLSYQQIDEVISLKQKNKQAAF